jgi:hypothetical protein
LLYSSEVLPCPRGFGVTQTFVPGHTVGARSWMTRVSKVDPVANIWRSRVRPNLSTARLFFYLASSRADPGQKSLVGVDVLGAY